MVGMMEDKNLEVESNNGSESSNDDDEVFLKIVTEQARKLNYSKVKEELLNVIERKRRKSDALQYEDVGEDVHIKVSRKPNEDFGLTLICGEVFTPSWPAIIDIRKNSPASEVDLKIGDQIKELLDIDTSTLAHWQLIGLFTNASDEITMTVRRGLDRSHTTFDWYKHPFSSVRQDFEELVISNVRGKSMVQRGKCTCHSRCSDQPRARMALKSFKLEDKLTDTTGNDIVCHKRTLSQSSAYKTDCVTGSETRSLNTYHTGLKSYPNERVYPVDDVENIANEIDRIYEQKSHLEVVRHSLGDSSSSMSSTLSDSTASSGTTFSDQIGGNQGNWMECMMIPSDTCSYSEEIFEDGFDKPGENTKYITRPATYKLGESFRRKKKKKGTSTRSDELKYTLRCNDVSDNTLLLTVWVIDRRKLGLQLGGGSVSAYGDSNVKIVDIKKTGTAHGVFRVGDEILEIGGMITNGLNVYDVNRIISNLEGQYVEFKIFRPKSF